jgi:hypothetical protein
MRNGFRESNLEFLVPIRITACMLEGEHHPQRNFWESHASSGWLEGEPSLHLCWKLHWEHLTCSQEHWISQSLGFSLMLVRLVAIFEKSRREASVLFRSEKLLYFMALFFSVICSPLQLLCVIKFPGLKADHWDSQVIWCSKPYHVDFQDVSDK